MSCEFPPKSWFKLNFNGSTQGDKASTGFIARIDICVLIGAGCFPVATIELCT